MKKTNAILLLLLVLFLGLTLGYRAGLRRALQKTGDEMASDQLKDAQHAAECEARGYLYSLQALDSGCTEDIAGLRRRALSHLRVYVQGVHDLRAQGYTWTPVNPELYTNAVAYLAEHSKAK